jgi:hypothetical protein
MALRKPRELCQSEPSVVRQERTLNKDSVQQLLAGGVQKLNDARQENVSRPTRVEAAYDAVLFCALAVFAAQGYRISSKPGHHKVALEGLAAELKFKQTLYDETDELLRTRNEKYTGVLKVSDADLRTALELAARVLNETEAWFGKNRPELLKS